jgi:hypothetical protein
MDKKLHSKILELQEQAENEPVSITLDWLSLYYTQNEHFATSIKDGYSVKISDNCYLRGEDRPTLHFNSFLKLIYHGEECATLLLNSKSEKFFAKAVVKVEVKNHALYSGAWIDLLAELENFGLRYKSAGRIDIAIDGLNSMHEMLNLYAQQNLGNKTLMLKNSSTARARFAAKVFNPATMLFENFNIGGSGGNKMITIYNKSLEIVKSGKKYIQEYWLRNGLIDGLQDLDKQAAQIEKYEAKGYETFHMEGFKNIYRFEIRLKSESIKEIENFTLDMLKTASGMASIVKLHCVKFFEPILNDAAKTNDCSAVNIIPFKRLMAVPLSKINRVETTGLYKAKMLLHGLIEDIYKSYVAVDKHYEIVASIFDRVERYKLADYLDNKMDEWERDYASSMPKEDIPMIRTTLGVIQSHLADYKSKYKMREDDADLLWDARIQKLKDDDLAARHEQAGATAAFGE